MNVLVGCEHSGVVRDAFLRAGHTALSCDLLPSQAPGPHIQADVRTLDLSGFDLAIFHPECTHLASSGARWFAQKRAEQEEALEFFRWCLNAPVPRVAVENPVSIASTHIKFRSQVIQPWMFGHGEVKTTCLWLKNLPMLRATNIVEGREQRCWRMSPSPDRWAKRSRTYEGIAEAMAQQWGNADYPLQLEWIELATV